jgi:Flp pilus assembly protein TadD
VAELERDLADERQAADEARGSAGDLRERLLTETGGREREAAEGERLRQSVTELEGRLAEAQGNAASANSAKEEALLRLRDEYETRLASEREQHSTIYGAEKAAREAYERTRRELAGQALELGMIHMRTRAWEKAGLYLQRVVEIDPRNAKAYYSLGEIYFQLGRFELSKEMYKKAQEVY